MPLPQPSDDESKDAFIGRCMESMSGEFPDESQRSAVCHAQWDKKQAKSKVAASLRMPGTSSGKNPGMASRWE